MRSPSLAEVLRVPVGKRASQHLTPGVSCGTLLGVASTLDKDKLHDVLDQAIVVIDAEDLERSRRDPRVRAFHDSAEQLLVELEAEGVEYS